LKDQGWAFAHCIAQDCKMGAGIAVPMKKEFNLHELGRRVNKYPDCVFYNNVFNLITKEYSNEKPTYESLKSSLEKMKQLVYSHKIKKIAMPKIGCGLDGLDWNKVRTMILNVFEGMDLEIKVCYL